MRISYQPYPKMKASSVKWLGDMPEHWQLCRLKKICRFAYGDSLATDERRGSDVAVYGSNGVVGRHETANTVGPTIVIGRKGSFGKINYSPAAVFAIDTTFIVDRRYTDQDMRWLSYLLDWLKLDSTSKDSAVPGLGREEAYRCLALLPSPSEQTAIARFLDHTTGLIDRYIRAKEKLIALLEEQKQVIIQDAVTGRIDVRTGKPYATYKHSGLEWLGEIPSHWDVVRNGQLFLQRNEMGFPDLPILEVSLRTGVRVRDFENSNRKQVMSDRNSYKRAVKGDIAYNMMRMWQGAVGVTPVDGLVSPAYVVASVRDGAEPHYFDYLFKTREYLIEVDKYSRGIVKDRNRLYWEDFKQMPTLRPPSDEQSLIVDAISSKAGFTRDAIRSTQRQITLANEFRTRLIADVVTGKLDVQEAASLLPDASSCAANSDAKEAVDAGEKLAFIQKTTPMKAAG